MEATELRIGNWVDAEFKKGIRFGVHQVDFDTFRTWNNEEIKTLFKPVPLTKEWLINFGFKENNVRPTGSYELGRIEINSREGCALIHSSEDWVLVDSVLYVHTLQNLYFALTGEELTIKN